MVQLDAACLKTSVPAIRPEVIEDILQSLPVGLVVISPVGDIIYANPSIHEILGIEPREFQDKGWGELFFHIEDNLAFNQVVIDAIREKKVHLHREVFYRKPSGETRRLSMTTSLLYENERVMNLTVLISDVTEVYRAQQRERSILKEKHRVQRDRVESLRNLALSVAHQIRNPVMLIGGSASRVMRKTSNEDPNRAYMQSILDGTRRLEDIVKGVRDYAEIPPLALKEVDLFELMETVQKRIKIKSKVRSVNIQWQLHLQSTRIQADPELLILSLEELLTNSLESFPGNEGYIRLSLTTGRDQVHLRVSDDGLGIRAEDLPYILDPFFTTKPSNTGIGLCKVDRIVRDHNGELTVTSEPGKGTVVDVRLPL